MPFDRGAFPRVTIGDDVRAQHRLLTEEFGISRLELVLGWSMGAQQTYEWAVRYPDMVRRAAPFAGFAKATPHNTLFVRVHEEAIRSDPNWKDGFYTEPHGVHLGLRRHARIFALMGASPELYKHELWRSLGYASLHDVVLGRKLSPQQEGGGFASLDDFLRCFWEGWFVPMDPNNLLCMAWKWRHGDVSRHADGNLEAALGRIKALTTVVAFSTDMFFPVADCAAEKALIPKSRLEVVDSPWGHFAMFCLRDEDRRAIDDILARLLAQIDPSV
jgi:homoserine O-acetyltransferase